MVDAGTTLLGVMEASLPALNKPAYIVYCFPSRWLRPWLLEVNTQFSSKDIRSLSIATIASFSVWDESACTLIQKYSNSFIPHPCYGAQSSIIIGVLTGGGREVAFIVFARSPNVKQERLASLVCNGWVLLICKIARATTGKAYANDALLQVYVRHYLEKQS